VRSAFEMNIINNNASAFGMRKISEQLGLQKDSATDSQSKLSYLNIDFCVCESCLNRGHVPRILKSTDSE